jgi:hypothetical protein
MNFKILVTVNKSNTIILFSLFLFYITVPYISLGIFEDLSFTCAAILSKSFLPWAVNLRPPLGSFSTSFNPSRDCKTLRATLVELLQKWLGAVPLRLRPTNNKHLLYRSQCNTDIFKWKKKCSFHCDFALITQCSRVFTSFLLNRSDLNLNRPPSFWGCYPLRFFFYIRYKVLHSGIFWP